MLFTFDGDVAIRYGVDEAVLFYHIAYWVYINELSEKNFYDGKYWTYNSGKAYERLFPYWSDRQIRNKLQHLVEVGLIVKGAFSENRYDHTSWYTLTDLGKSISQNWVFDWTKITNQSDKKYQSYNTTNNIIVPTSNNYPNIYMGEKPKITKPKDVKSNPPTVEEVRAYCIERNNSVDAEAFVNFYESKGWLIGKNPMKDWKAAVRTWERNRDSKSNGKGMSEIDRKQRQGYTDLENYLNGHIG